MTTPKAISEYKLAAFEGLAQGAAMGQRASIEAMPTIVGALAAELRRMYRILLRHCVVCHSETDDRRLDECRCGGRLDPGWPSRLEGISSG